MNETPEEAPTEGSEPDHTATELGEIVGEILKGILGGLAKK